MLNTDTAIAGAPVDLVARAFQAARDAGFVPGLPESAALSLMTPPSEEEATLPDRRGLLWSSIDNPESRDLDQVEWAERLPDGTIRVCVGIADVDYRVKAGSALDAFAFRSTTSVYTGVATFPMLPEVLSTNLTSLNPGEDRAAIVTEFIVAPDGGVSGVGISRALLRNHAKLDYETIGAWLESRTPIPPAVASVPGLSEQIEIQAEASARLLAMRRKNGTLELETIEVEPVVDANGKIVRLETPRHNAAQTLVENLMVTTNTLVADFLSAHGVSAIARVVRPPGRWKRIVELAAGRGAVLPETPDAPALAAFLRQEHDTHPTEYGDVSLSVVKLLGGGDYVLALPGEYAGHFGLGAARYTHSTAPNRRYVDLVIQRQVKALIAGKTSPYDADALTRIAAHCNEREDAAHKVERVLRKTVSGVFLQAHIGETFRAVITLASAKGVFVRILTAPAVGVEGRLVIGEEGLDVGDTVPVRLIATDIERGFIDFARIDGAMDDRDPGK